ncbi:hypothetical protein EJB05_35414 [Eragrostis curvula]|uniref:CUE domain-containing protein n=1 Tax=Eragrostis curvula TaxID=38414 RepID=A0A5J9U6N9_9POAL|nr:hypothetical protein EJB05_35414 [Eragrostis curvula]
MDGSPILDSLIEVFPQVNLSTLIEVSIQFKDDIDAAADYVIQNVLPNMVPHPSHPNTNEALLSHELQQASDVTSTQLLPDPVDNGSNSNMVQSFQTQSPTGLHSDVSTSGEECVSEGFSSDSSLDDSELHASETNPEISASECVMSPHDNGSPDMLMRSSYSVNPLESIDGVIADEQQKKVALLSNAAAVSEMLQEVELNEEKTKHVVASVSQAGDDILQKVVELKVLTDVVVNDNSKVTGEIIAEQSILATEAQALQTRLFHISEETKKFELTIDQMNQTLQKRLAASEVERAAAEKAKLEKEASAQKSLREQQLSLEAANEEFRWLEQRSQENAKLKELLVDRGHAVDALHGEMLGIFDSITELMQRVDMQLPVDEAPSLPCSAVFFQGPCSAVDEPLQQASSSLSSSAVDVPLQPASSATLLKSASSKSGSIKSLASKSSWSSFAESRWKDGNIDISNDNFALDDSWDVVDDDDDEVPASPYATPILL